MLTPISATPASSSAPFLSKCSAVLAAHGVQVPSPCGGTGTCGQCQVTVALGGGEVLPTEAARLTRAEMRSGVRPACQVTLRADMAVRVSNEILAANTWECTVAASRTVAPLI
ncbi:MAG: 2Fe-2S iron-sulfur cluster binding domain-containing protein, partial [Bryobacteraceae bacterium]|nr:2Fe-2S iron-sulfur cluster binding domain-containing protein [Bryobacteraceae bacterium]